MKIGFRRIISKGSFIPEIDGLRFIAIASVVLYHLNGFLLEKDTSSYKVEYDFDMINKILSAGHLGVPLFFVISGFILARPFAQMRINNGSKINIKNYFIRRVTRLEPPYILIMTILLFGTVYVAKVVSLSDGIVSYFASITYTHNFFYGKETFPLLNTVAWSLEIEIQFYLLMPLLANIFVIKKDNKRRTAIMMLALLFLILDLDELMPFRSIINYMHYFLIGLLLADIYVCSIQLEKIKYAAIISILSFIVVWLIELIEPSSALASIIFSVIQIIAISVFYYLVIIHRSIRLLANPIITNIGGMCYTIYLLHYPLISMIGNPLMKINFSNNSLVKTLACSSILLFVVMIFSASYFLLIERPCMDKNWYKKILKRISTMAIR